MLTCAKDDVAAPCVRVPRPKEAKPTVSRYLPAKAAKTPCVGWGKAVLTPEADARVEAPARFKRRGVRVEITVGADVRVARNELNRHVLPDDAPRRLVQNVD